MICQLVNNQVPCGEDDIMNKIVVLKTILAALLLIADSSISEAERLVVLSSFSTSVQDQEENVKKNILLACHRLNGYVIMPGLVFSFNDVVGEGSAKNGYVTGRVLYRDEIRYESGGGLCQVSSTLFNALLLAGFNIVERHRHYQPVTYVPYGLDATIKYGKKDLRMKNVVRQRVFIEAMINDKSLIIQLKGYNSLKYRYELFTEVDEIETPFVEKRDRIRNGISVYVFRKKFSNQRLIESFLLYKDFYPAVFLR